jgi:WD40 repeat protein
VASAILLGWLIPAQGQALADKAESPRLIAQFGHTRSVSSVALSRDGKGLFTASHDTTAKLWEVATGREVRTFHGHGNYVTSLAVSADGKWLATGSWDGTARLWDVATGRTLRIFRAHAAKLTGLKVLNLYAGPADDTGLAALVPLTRLEELTLGGLGRVTDASVEHLARLKNLKRLTLSGTKITDAATQRLRAALPGARIFR